MAITERRLNRATLARQLLLDREALDVVSAVQRVVALQAQEPASPYLALWNRIAGFAPAKLDLAFREAHVVKAPLMRITLHAVTAEDRPAFHAAMLPTLRAPRLGDERFTSSGVTVEEADALVPQLLAFLAVPRTGPEVDAWLAEQVGRDAVAGVWWALRSYAPLRHSPTGGPWSFGPRNAYAAAGHVPAPEERDAGLAVLVRRYLEGFGPATLADVAGFCLVQKTRARKAVADLGDRLVRLEGPGGVELLDVPAGAVPREDVPAPARLMAMWDSVLLAYADRSRVVPPAYRKLVTRANGDVLPTLLVDGHVAGVWRPVEGGIEATAFHQLAEEAWAQLEAEAGALLELLADRDPAVYRRYARWWASLPAGEVRVLPG
ncbi:winged helix DNA-binding domain-containing protein [Motilibacter aurantiacus]|uniref:winged helix DNA-binding domain-containing protein n=1 Tax=Motilibacter aurantiacus TaxID=2714955 RepID=UPI00140A8AF0|nr:winged helix DNA-binding domain-containing protein [Motilibacter aurantiacus]NHC45544.1 winged helix DNA-binding domain-containing protein [Motilibacter aurantiacus]